MIEPASRQYTWQTTRNVAVDKTGNFTSFTKAVATKPITIHFVFDPMVNSSVPSTNNFRGGHGLEMGREGNEEFLVCLQKRESFAQLTLEETVWEKYAPGQRSLPKGRGWTRSGQVSRKGAHARSGCISHQFCIDDGGFLLADGYDSFCIHRYDKDVNWVRVRRTGKRRGKSRPSQHLDRCREGKNNASPFTTRPPHLAVLKWTGNGETLKGYGMPANLDTWRNLLLVPELHAHHHAQQEQVVLRWGTASSVVKKNSEPGQD